MQRKHPIYLQQSDQTFHTEASPCMSLGQWDRYLLPHFLHLLLLFLLLFSFFLNHSPSSGEPNSFTTHGHIEAQEHTQTHLRAGTVYVLCCYINFIMAGQQKWWNTSHYRVPSTIKSHILVKCQGTIIFPHTLYTCNLFLLVFLFSEYFSRLYWLEGIWILFLPQAQEEKNKTTLTFLNQSVISSECIWSRTVYSLCFLGLLGGMNVDVCIDGIKLSTREP